MAKSKLTYDQARRIGLAFPEVAESTSYGTPALKVRGKLMLRLKDNETLVCRTAWDERERRLALEPEIFFLSDHYRKHPWVLLRLSAATATVLRSAIEHAWLQSAPRSLVVRHVANPERDDARRLARSRATLPSLRRSSR